MSGFTVSVFRQQHVSLKYFSAFGVPYSALLLGALTLWCCLELAQPSSYSVLLFASAIVDFCRVYVVGGKWSIAPIIAVLHA